MMKQLDSNGWKKKGSVLIIRRRAMDFQRIFPDTMDTLTVDLKLVDASIVWNWDLWLQISTILKFIGLKISVKLSTTRDT